MSMQQYQNLSFSTFFLQGVEFLSLPNAVLDQVIQERMDNNPFLVQDFADASPPWNARGGKAEFFEESVVYQETLMEHFREEFRLDAWPEDDRQIGELLVSALDSYGFLPAETLQALTHTTGKSLQQLETLRQRITLLEPIGHACLNSLEFLQMQAGLYYGKDSLAYLLLTQHFDTDSANLAATLEIPESCVQQALAQIQTLSLYPSLTDVPNPAIRPDMSVHIDQGKLHLDLYDDFLPTVRVSQEWMEDMDPKDHDTQTRAFLSDKLKEAQTLISALDKRKKTLRRVALSICEAQMDFLTHGPQHLKPLQRNNLAVLLKLHPATISRATKDKYLRCNWGTFALDTFFQKDNAFYPQVVALIKRILAVEDSANPLSDSALATALRKHGWSLSRRSVANYRKRLSIPTADQRKQAYLYAISHATATEDSL